MDWFHCNQCFTRRGSKFAVSSCGHICCEACIKTKQCSICGTSCSYLPITEEMKPQEKVFFKDPVKLIQSRLEHILQVALFQRSQMERVTAYFKHKSVELDKRLKEVTEQSYRQLSELKRENADLKKRLSELKKETAELKKPLSQRRISPGQFLMEGSQRMSRPVAVTSPVTPRSRPMRYVFHVPAIVEFALNFHDYENKNIEIKQSLFRVPCCIVLNNGDLNINLNNLDYDLCHNGAALRCTMWYNHLVYIEACCLI
uniref:Si:ch211-10e2.1 n=1 Tax=Labrus bergylta TaxID=56723 RepID=A0A3Q3E6L2_9LABR